MPPIRLKPTQAGFDYFEAVSALQKFCRRGMVDEAIYMATELSISGYYEAVWKRLQIIAIEDVGTGNPNLIVELRALYDASKVIGKKDDPFHLGVIEATLRVCESPKTRRADNIYGLYIEHRHRLPPFVIPDWTKGMFTREGKKRGRGNLYFYLVESVVHPAADIVDRWLKPAMALFLKPNETIGAAPEDLPEEQPWSSEMPDDIPWLSEGEQPAVQPLTTPDAKQTSLLGDDSEIQF